MNECGDDVDFTVDGNPFYFEKESVYLLEQRIVMNDAFIANGVIQVYINGHLVVDEQNLMLSESGDYSVNHLLLDFWHGGNDSSYAPNVDSVAWFDDFAITTAPLSF